MNIIAGLEDSDLGTKDHPNDYTISYLSQDPQFDEKLTIMEYMYESSTPVFSLIKEYEKTLVQLQLDPQNSATTGPVVKATTGNGCP